jgi:hypothetical protein
MPTREQHRAAAAIRHDLDRAITNILQRREDPATAALEIHAAYTGRYELCERAVAGQKCKTHTGTALQGGSCPICGPQGD